MPQLDVVVPEKIQVRKQQVQRQVLMGQE